MNTILLQKCVMVRTFAHARSPPVDRPANQRRLPARIPASPSGTGAFYFSGSFGGWRRGCRADSGPTATAERSLPHGGWHGRPQNPPYRATHSHSTSNRAPADEQLRRPRLCGPTGGASKPVENGLGCEMLALTDSRKRLA